jgi:type IV secretory pathway VirB10-like protein
MNKRNLIVILIAIALATSALALGGISTAQQPANKDKATVSSPSGLKPKPEGDAKSASQAAQPNTQAQNPTAQPKDQSVPEYVVYGQMFRHIKELKKKADEEDRQGKDGAHFRTLYKRAAKLEDHQAATLDQLADEVDREVEKLNRRAKKIIDEIRGRHPEGKLAQGELPPEPPAELKMLSDERRNLILHARERLRASFGEEAFQQFDGFVQQRIKSGIRRLDASNSSSQNGSQGLHP